MIWYLGRRLLQMIPVVLGATLIVYLMAFASSGDPIAAIAGDKPISPAVADKLRAQYNLDKPVIFPWLIYLRNLFQGDFGGGFNGIAGNSNPAPAPNNGPANSNPAGPSNTGAAPQQNNNPANDDASQDPFANSGKDIDISDDDLPF